MKSSGGRLWRDRERLAWIDPSKKEAWDYSIDIAVEAARNGFDDIQSHVRFPDAKGIVYSIANTEQNRVEANRPWLQAFRDYAFNKREFGSKEIVTQVKAAEDFGSDGWMLWNPHNVYPAGTVVP